MQSISWASMRITRPEQLIWFLYKKSAAIRPIPSSAFYSYVSTSSPKSTSSISLNISLLFVVLTWAPSFIRYTREHRKRFIFFVWNCFFSHGYAKKCQNWWWIYIILWSTSYAHIDHRKTQEPFFLTPAIETRGYKGNRDARYGNPHWMKVYLKDHNRNRFPVLLQKHNARK